MGSPAANVNSDDCYKVLGVDRRASDQEIKAAYRKLALKYHPDKNPDNTEAARTNFNKVSEAYDTLHDPEKRKVYDQFGKQGSPGGFRGHHGGGMSTQHAEDLFQAFFGGDPFGGGMAGMPGGTNSMFGGTPGRSQFHFQQGGGGFSGAGGFGGNMFGGMTQPDPFGGVHGGRQAQQPCPPCCLTNATNVVVRGLTTASEHNGKSGTVVGWDAQRCRYQIQLQSGGTVSLRSQNLVQRCRVEVIGIQSKPEMNGKIAEVFGFDDEKGRYSVRVEDSAMAMGLQAGNCLLKQGTAITLQGLSDHSLNGMMAQIVAVDRPEAKYTVQCQSGRQVRVKADKVLF